MPDVKISALPSATTPLAGTEVLPIVQGGTTDQVSVANLTAGRSVAASGLAIDANSSGDAVRITQTGSGNALLIEDSASPDATPFVIDGAGNVVIGYSTTVGTVTYSGSALTPPLQTQGVGMANSAFGITNWANNNTSASSIVLSKSKSNIIGTRGAVSINDVIGAISFTGDDGTSFVNAATITASVDATPGTNDMPGRLLFSTTADGASTPTERMRIDSSGQVGIGGTPSAGRTLTLSKALTGGTTTYGILSGGTVQSDVTSAAYNLSSFPSTVASSFTLTSLGHFFAQQGTFGAGSIVTNQFGFNANSNLIGATNNYGFYGNIPAGTGRYNFYANGTAQNLFSGDVLIFGAGAIGYATGSGGAVTQATSRTTGVTLNKTNGAITLVSAAGTTAYQSFTVTNSTVAATDVIRVCQKSGTDKYIIAVTNVSAGSFEITFATTGGTTTEQPVFNFSVTKAVTS